MFKPPVAPPRYFLIWRLSFFLGFRISLRDVGFHANTEGFQGSVPLLPHLCPLSVLKRGGGGGMGYIWKALEKGFSEMYG